MGIIIAFKEHLKVSSQVYVIYLLVYLNILICLLLAFGVQCVTGKH